jgi:hypothetical protein
MGGTHPVLATGVMGDEMRGGGGRPAPPMLRARELLRRRSIFIPALALIALFAALVEIRTSTVQALALSNAARSLTYRVEAGPSPSARFPRTGPYDQRLGYTRLPPFIDRLQARGYRVDAQARISTGLERLSALGISPPYHEKTRAGLEVLDRDDNPIYARRDPEGSTTASTRYRPCL